jgi:hypothetical protein
MLFFFKIPLVFVGAQRTDAREFFLEKSPINGILCEVHASNHFHFIMVYHFHLESLKGHDLLLHREREARYNPVSLALLRTSFWHEDEQSISLAHLSAFLC